MSSDSRRTSRCFSWMSLNQSTSMSSSRPSATRCPLRPGLAAGPARRESGARRPLPARPPALPQLSHHSPRLAASPPAAPHGVPGRPAGARWCPPLGGCPPQGCTGQPGPARQHPGHLRNSPPPPACCQELHVLGPALATTGPGPGRHPTPCAASRVGKGCCGHRLGHSMPLAPAPMGTRRRGTASHLSWQPCPFSATP